MQTYIVTLKKGNQRTIKADRVEVNKGELRFYAGEAGKQREIARFQANEWSGYEEEQTSPPEQVEIVDDE